MAIENSYRIATWRTGPSADLGRGILPGPMQVVS